ncbi:hypothetical protein DUT91_20800 [Phyllobacterium salinisoli]|uniref:Uncharacterized protein n=2 Tax=Phyllobacterium salinisoli TaxID=1899321 RepID=A0A368JXV7_9HYPH|nr:hypothetical protein DUT91_20800 [Phyllobacterium salinisoli]
MNDMDVSRIEVLSYLQQMLGEMHWMAHSANYPMLAYFIKMAHIESEDTIRAEREAMSGLQERDGTA